MILPTARASRTRPIITVTTDFGLSDHYVGTMKGVLLSRCPEATLVDISHQVKSFSVLEGAYTISQAAPYFPPGTVHLIVVDPGVGTARKPIAVDARNQLFIAPDNGVLSMVLDDEPYAAYAIENRELMSQQRSDTFHGRDVFAPAAATLATGTLSPDQAGERLEQIELLTDWKERKTAPTVWEGKVLSVDQFGNVITNFAIAEHENAADSSFQLKVGGTGINTFRRTFGLADPGTLFVYFGSSGFLEIGMNRDSAAARLGVEAGTDAKLFHSKE